MMKIILFHSRSISDRKIELKKGLLVFVCLEKNDTLENINSAVNEILRATEYLKENEVCLVPFPKLSLEPDTYQNTIGILRSIANTLRNKSISVNMIDIDKSSFVEFEIIGHRASVGYREV